jgi:hypothetical protein
VQIVVGLIEEVSFGRDGGFQWTMICRCDEIDEGADLAVDAGVLGNEGQVIGSEVEEGSVIVHVG